MIRIKNVTSTTNQTVIFEFHNRDDMYSFLASNQMPDDKIITDCFGWGDAVIELLDYHWQIDEEMHEVIEDRRKSDDQDKKPQRQAMAMDARHMLDNMACASQSVALRDDPIVRKAVMAGVRQFIELNWACASADLIEHLKLSEKE